MNWASEVTLLWKNSNFYFSNIKAYETFNFFPCLFFWLLGNTGSIYKGKKRIMVQITDSDSPNVMTIIKYQYLCSKLNQVNFMG